MPNLAKTYQKKTDIEHILDAPDTYIGAVDEDTTRGYSFQTDDASLTHHSFSWVPGLYKCFDEGIVNCRDHFVRMKEKIKKGEKGCVPVQSINISVDKLTYSFQASLLANIVSLNSSVRIPEIETKFTLFT